MRVLVVLVGAVFAQADAPSDSSLPEVSADIEVGVQPGEVDGPEEPPLESRSTAEWRKFFIGWRREAVSAVPARYPLREKDLALLERVRDGNAVPAIAALYHRERNLLVRMAYLRALAHIETTRAIEMLVQVSLADKDARLRRLAAEGIAKMRNREESLELYTRAIRNGQKRELALEVLQNAELVSPVSPGELPDPTLTTALIDSLFCARVVRPPVKMSYGARGSGSGGQYMYSGRVSIPALTIPVPNQNARDVLTSYTGEDYGYDQNAWRAWYKARQREFADDVE